MSDRNANLTPQDGQKALRLDDESRVKVLSPSMLVVKRFLRNRLAITGLIILIVMFIFSFLGAVISPYGQTEVFYKYETMWKEYASVIENNELRYVAAEGVSFSTAGRAQFVYAINNNQPSFSADGHEYMWEEIGEDSYRIFVNEEIATVLNVKENYTFRTSSGEALPEAVTEAFTQARAAEESAFALDGERYGISGKGKNLTLSKSSIVAIASMRVFDAYHQADADFVTSFAFRKNAEDAIVAEEASFEVDGIVYDISMDEETVEIFRNADGERTPFAIASVLIARAISPEIYIDVPFKDAILTAIQDNQKEFTYVHEDGAEVDYQIQLVNNTYTIKRETISQQHDTYASPSGSHWLGTDGNGMDMLTRLMYGGRISLMVGFVVVLIEIVIGVVVGGIAGYFGGWVDTLLMRFIDLFNCIPYYPVMIIAGAVMDSLQIDPYARIFILMFLLGILNWTGIARVVRGQILTLREQDFMVATEATGVRVSRRIFRHLVPNVMPLLIVQATMGLGGIIITEATLSFLGLGLKYPMASWGTIINAATNIYVMTNFWFIWIPAGVLILLTVLGFNFVGDGLRDAFDPKMKR